MPATLRELDCRCLESHSEPSLSPRLNRTARYQWNTECIVEQDLGRIRCRKATAGLRLLPRKLLMCQPTLLFSSLPLSLSYGHAYFLTMGLHSLCEVFTLTV